MGWTLKTALVRRLNLPVRSTIINISQRCPTDDEAYCTQIYSLHLLPSRKLGTVAHHIQADVCERRIYESLNVGMVAY